MLEVHDLQVWYGAAPALWGVSLALCEGELLSVVGPNGAGKTTLINALCGIEPARAGSIVFAGADITRWPAHRFCAAGIAVVPEGRRLFSGMTVLENLEMGAFSPRARAERTDTLRLVLEVFPILAERRGQKAATLSGGQQQMLAVGRALMGLPQLLLLDEPSLGLAPLVVESIFSVVRQINDRGVAVLLVEQNARMALDIASRAYVLEQGKVVVEGRTADLLADSRVQQAYLGSRGVEQVSL